MQNTPNYYLINITRINDAGISQTYSFNYPIQSLKLQGTIPCPLHHNYTKRTAILLQKSYFFTNALFFQIITIAPTTISNPAAIGSIGMFPPVCGVSGTSRIGASLTFTVCTFPVSLIVNCIGFGS